MKFDYGSIRAVVPELNWLDSLKGFWQNLHDKIVLWLASLDLRSDLVIETATCVILGFLTGFILSRHLRFLVILIMMVLGLAWLFQEINFIQINWSHFNWVSNDDLGTLITNLAQWTKAHIIAAVGFLVAFLIGYKI